MYLINEGDNMAGINVNAIVDELKDAGYFRTDRNRKVIRYNALYDSFQELNDAQFVNVLSYIIGVENAHNYSYSIKINLDEFPAKAYERYLKFQELSMQPKFEPVADEFMNTYYKRNVAIKKPVTETLTVNTDYSVIVQFLINSDIFTDGNALYKFDIDSRTFNTVTADNIGSCIDCQDVELCNRIYDVGMHYRNMLVNAYNYPVKFQEAEHIHNQIESCKDDASFIAGLIENINPKFENTYSLIM